MAQTVITGGSYKGRRITVPSSASARATSQRVRQAVFNTIGNDLEGLCFLDLFAGCGAAGIEAMSRGASPVYFVEKNSVNYRLIRKNIEKMKAIDGSCIMLDDVTSKRFWTKMMNSKTKFDVVFADPPYRGDFVENLIENLDNTRILKKKGVIIVEHLSKVQVPEETEFFTLWKSRKYGETSVTYYRMRG